MKKNQNSSLRRELDKTKEKLKGLQKSLESKVLVRTEELEEARVKEEAILESIGDGLVATDNKGRIIRVNKTAERLLGVRAKDICGKSFTKAFQLEDEKGNVIKHNHHPVDIALRSTQATETISTTYYYVRKDKTKFPVANKVTRIVLDGKVIGTIDIFRDVTQEKEVDKAKSEFVSLAAHQLRTPLTAVNWYTEMLLMGDAGKLNGDQRKYLEEIYTGNQRMVSLVNTLLNVSHLELGTFIIKPESVDIRKIAEKVIKELEPDIFKRKIGLNEHYDKELSKFNADQRLIHMIFENLLSNAIKYTPEKGHVNFSIKRQAKNFLVTIQDTGYGIPKKQQDKIFSKLFRADNVVEKDTEGTGLGLYIVKAMVEHSGGKIWFTSIEDKGTTFHVTFPIKNVKKGKIDI